MIDRRSFLGFTAAAAVSGCAAKPEWTKSPYTGPEVTHVEVRKSDRSLWLWSNGEVIRNYEIDLGFAPSGHKQFEGDGKTPEGQYFINRRNPRSQFYLSLGISYPNARDIAYARAHGRDPGGDIFIHGASNGLRLRGVDRPNWTAGCIAVSNADIAELYWMVRVGTPITIRA